MHEVRPSTPFDPANLLTSQGGRTKWKPGQCQELVAPLVAVSDVPAGQSVLFVLFHFNTKDMLLFLYCLAQSRSPPSIPGDGEGHRGNKTVKDAVMPLTNIPLAPPTSDPPALISIPNPVGRPVCSRRRRTRRAEGRDRLLSELIGNKHATRLSPHQLQV